MLNKMAKLFFVALVTVSVNAFAELPDFTKLIEKNSPAVVKIEVEGKAASNSQQEQMEEMLRRFFGQRGRPQQQPRRSSGSGFVVSEDGYILTNHHVVENGDTITVRFSDREEFDAEIVGTDPATDLALLKIDADDLPTVTFGESENLKVGEWVVAIGSPFGLDYSASVGIVSAIGRSIPTENRENYVPFIQTDVAINPGNSGGPLFNLDGEVVGINSQIYTRSGGSNGISFSIPSHVAQSVMEQLKDGGTVQRGWFGISMQEITKENAEAFGLDSSKGILVSEVFENSPAEKAGIEPADVIAKIDGKTINQPDDVSPIVSNIAPGTKIKVELIREGKSKTVNLVVGSREDGQVASADKGDKFGLVVEDMDERTRARLGLRAGVIVKSVEAGSPAADKGLQPGDVIDRMGRMRIRDIEDYRALRERYGSGRGAPMRVIRDGRANFVTIRAR